MTVWPDTLPQRFSAQGLKIVLPKNGQASEMDQGPPKRRLRTVSNVGKITGTMVMSLDQWVTLRNFFQITVSEVLPFDFPDPDNNENSITVIFTEPPDRSYYVPGKVTVALSFEVQP